MLCFLNPLTLKQLSLGLLIAFALPASSVCLAATDNASALLSSVTPVGSVPSRPLPTLSITSLEFAQTHVIPEAGLSWIKSDGSSMGALHLTAQRDTLVLFDLGAATPKSPAVQAWRGAVMLGVLPLKAPALLPSTEGAGRPYSTTKHSAPLPAAWVINGVQLRLVAQDYSPSAYKVLAVGADIDFNMQVLPMYLYGATEANTQPYSVTANATQAAQDELYAKWPISRLNMKPAPARRLDWPYLIVAPREGVAAYRANSKSDEKDSYDSMSSALDMLGALLSANGDTNTNTQMYGALMMLDATGKYADPDGGLGGDSVGTGDYRYEGVFIHEQGHAFGMPHAKDGYASGEYPYPNGSLLGSRWGYDVKRQQFLAPYVPASAESFRRCKTDGQHVLDAAGRCAKQDIMQSGDGDQAKGYRYTMFSDFNAGVIQRYFEGTTTLDAKGGRSYSGGTIFIDSNSPTGYSRWDSLDKKRVTVTPSQDDDKGLNGIDRGLANKRGVPVHTVMVTINTAKLNNTTQIYPVLSYVGNLRPTIDPTDPAQLASVVPNTGKYPWFCHNSGCDYTLRATYANGSVAHVMLQKGTRKWFAPTSTTPANKLNSLSSHSFSALGVNLPGAKPLAKVELLSTPMAWKGLPVSPVVLATRVIQ